MRWLLVVPGSLTFGGGTRPVRAARWRRRLGRSSMLRGADRAPLARYGCAMTEDCTSSQTDALRAVKLATARVAASLKNREQAIARVEAPAFLVILSRSRHDLVERQGPCGGGLA